MGAARTDSACLVTGYVDLGQPNRSHAAYVDLGRQLLGLGLRTHAFLDRDTRDEIGPLPDAVTVAEPGESAFPVIPGPEGPRVNPTKDTPQYFALQHRKAEWLAEAVAAGAGDVLAWVDFGILHVPRVGPAEIAGFFDRLPQARRDRITVPSIWGAPQAPPLLTEPAWNFAGGVLIVPAHLAEEFYFLCLQTREWIAEEYGFASWEVNTWAAVALRHPLLFDFYECDHNCTLFDAFQPGGVA